VAALVAVEDSAAEGAADSEEASTMDLERCIRQFVLTVSKNVKYHSSQQKVNQFIANNVISREKTLEMQELLVRLELKEQKLKTILKSLNQTENKSFNII
jgi:hypothetical protein